MPVSDSIRTIRKRTLMSQEEFAKVLGVSVGTINRWENGKSKPNIAALKQLKNFCINNEVPFDDIEEEWVNRQ